MCIGHFPSVNWCIYILKVWFSDHISLAFFCFVIANKSYISNKSKIKKTPAVNAPRQEEQRNSSLS